MRLNGWQRLWLVGTVCLGLWLVGWWPLQLIGTERDSSSWYDRQAIERDFSNPLCRAYQVGPISALSEPPPTTTEGRAGTSIKAADPRKTRKCRTRWRPMIDTGLHGG